LDVGCQTGEFGLIALRDGIVPYGIEMSEPYADICRHAWGRGSRIHYGSISSADFKPNSFDYITAFETLEHMCDPIEALQKMRSWLKKDGVIAISVPASDYFHFKYWILAKQPASNFIRNALMRSRPFYSRQVLPHTHIYNFSKKSVALMLNKAGFRTIHMSLTGWHGYMKSILNTTSNMLDFISASRISLAPSIFAIASQN
jgi:2-polyprenyl-3-methyl-5-hydroxy-6-metoxy-1,4-benzoquinol methylase